MIDLDNKSIKIVVEILNKYLPSVEVKAFGSRVTGKAKQFSDLDLVIMSHEPIPIETLNEFKFAFSDSDLPILVDVVDWSAITDEFREKIKDQCVALTNSH